MSDIKNASSILETHKQERRLKKAKRRIKKAIAKMGKKERNAFFLWLDGDTEALRDLITMVGKQMPDTFDENGMAFRPAEENPSSRANA